MTTGPANPLELERELLNILCAGVLSEEERGQTVLSLAEYEWKSPDHRVIFEALRRARQLDASEIRERLRAEVTRLGFPDIDWAEYFHPLYTDKAQIEKLIRALLNGAREGPNQP
jgi:hypothetical protein